MLYLYEAKNYLCTQSIELKNTFPQNKSLLLQIICDVLFLKNSVNKKKSFQITKYIEAD